MAERPGAVVVLGESATENQNLIGVLAAPTVLNASAEPAAEAAALTSSTASTIYGAGASIGSVATVATTAATTRYGGYGAWNAKSASGDPQRPCSLLRV